MTLPPLTMQVTPMVYGKRCHVCKGVGRTVAFRIWQGDQVRRNLQICEACLGTEVSAEVSLQGTQERNPLQTKAAKARVKRSRQMEASLAERMGARAQPASGSSRLAGFKGDVRKMGSWRVEHKFTDATKTYVLKLSDLAKIIGQAMDANEFPAMVLEFTRAKESFAIIPLTLFLEMVDATDKHSAPARRRSKER